VPIINHQGLTAMAKLGDLPRYRSNLQGEVDGAAVYAALAESEADPKLAEVFRRLAAVEQAHGEFWRKQIEAEGGRFTPRPSGRARVMAWLARRFGPAFVLPTLADLEARDSASYDNQPEARDAGLPSDERSHALVMRTIAGGGGLAGPTVAMLEGRHRGGGNTLRAAVLGANDGLVSISAWSWAWPARPWPTTPSCSRGWPGSCPAPARWRWESGCR
jgi:hypothetical protein